MTTENLTTEDIESMKGFLTDLSKVVKQTPTRLQNETFKELADRAFAALTEMQIAPLFNIDAYKLGHRLQYRPGITSVYSNFTNRGSRIEGITDVVHFGLQYALQRYLSDAWMPFFSADEDAVAEAYEKRTTEILGPNNVGSDHIRALHRLGYLPLRFSAPPEGTLIPLRVPSFVFESTHPDFFWLTNYVETILSASTWQASTSATIALQYRRLLDAAAERTGGPAEFVDWQGHDFSFRGMSSLESAQLSGAGHLLSFTGTDTLPALSFINQYYPGENGFLGGSVPATEHSVMCAGTEAGEFETYSRLLDIHPTGILSVVSDTWDFWNVLTNILPALRDKIMSRDGKLVVRPDSGDPADIICGKASRTGGTEYYLRKAYEKDPTLIDQYPEDFGAVEILWEKFGGTVNEKGFKELDPHIGLIYGDSITLERARNITERLERKGFASTNVVFGIGSFTYQYNTRDTFGSAIKATQVVVDGEPQDIQKNPKTDTGLKKSATGRLAVLHKADGTPYLIERATPEQEAQSLLQPVWEDGRFLRKQSFADVRATLKRSAAIAARAGR